MILCSDDFIHDEMDAEDHEDGIEDIYQDEGMLDEEAEKEGDVSEQFDA